MADEPCEASSPAALEALAVALDPVVPAPDARVRLLADIASRRYAPFVAELSALFQLEPQRMRELLRRIDAPDAWIRGVPPLQGFLDFRPGAPLVPLRGGFVRMEGGARFPRHRHRHREVTFVLEGSLVDGDGQTYLPGDVIDMPPGSVHSIGVPEGTAALLALLHGRIEMLGDEPGEQ